MLLNFDKLFGNKERDSKLTNKNVVKATSEIKLDFENKLDETLNIQEGKVTIQFTGSSPAGKSLIVGFFIQNGFRRQIVCTNVSLILIDSNKNVLARQSFDGDTIGEVNARSEKACVARFSPKNVFASKIPRDSQLCFDLS